MRIAITAVEPTGAEPRHVVLGLHPDTPLHAVADRLAEGATQLYLAADPLDPLATLAGSGIRDGAVLGVGVPPPRDADRPDGRGALVELHCGGRVWPVGLGSHEIGSAARCAIRVDCPEDRAAVLSVHRDGTATLDVPAGSSARLLPVVAPEPAEGSTPAAPAAGRATRADQDWAVGTELLVGEALLRLCARGEPDAAVRPSDDGVGLDYNRPPRIVPPIPLDTFRIPHPPVKPPRRPIPWLMTLSPLVMGFAMVYFFKSYYFLIFSLLSPVMMMANWASDKRTGRRSYARELRDYQRKRIRITEEVRAAVEAERRTRAEVAPDPAAVLLAATGPNRRLWERRRRDPDHLVLRIGTADQPSLIEVEDPEREDRDRKVRWTVPNAPSGVSVTDRGVLGLAGPTGPTRALARWLVTQIAVLHSPKDVQVWLLTGADAAADWDWLRWLPHARPGGGRGPAVLVGNDPETVANRVAELVAVIRARTQARGSTMGQVLFAEPDLVVVVDGARGLRDVPGMVQVLAEGPAVRVFLLCLDLQERLLPEECTAVLRLEADGLLTLRQHDLPTLAGIRPDLVAPDWCERIARRMTPLRDVTSEDASGLPDSVALLDLLDVADPDPARIAERWARRPASTVLPVGVGFDGPVAFDLVADGPHGLIAGTTGSGKSELLQTLVASAAVANRPDELVFVLVDYKGGSAFRDCVRLPHTLGMVTDLDAHLVERALDSLGAELRRREALLAEVGAKDHPEYHARRRREPDLPPLPRLVIVIDEFASLVREVPTFVAGLVSIAQRGRSLGLHLILATQRPAGVVTQDIKANVNLRIALRVTDPTESMDVIDRQDAVSISSSTPGRALARLAHRSVVPFQTAYAGNPRTSGQVPVEVRPAGVWLAELPWSRLGRPLPVEETAHREVPLQEVETDLGVLVDAVNAAATLAAVARQPSPWLPPLAPRLVLDDLPAPEYRGRGLAPVPYAVEDLPAEQAHRVVSLDLATFGHLYVIGAARSGRSQTLRTLAGALARAHSVADVHLYGIDAAGGALTVLGELPHCGAVVPRADFERVDRLLTRLTAELTRRQDLMMHHNCASLTELRAALPSADRPAHVLLFLDGWESLYAMTNDHDNGRLTEEIVRLLREGAAAGVHLVIAADRSLLVGRVSALNDQRILLRLNDRGDYATIGIPFSKLPTVVFPGRGWRSGNLAETQIALLAPEPGGQQQAAALRAIATLATARDASVPAARRPSPIGTLPTALEFTAAYDRVPADRRRPTWGLLGVGGDDLEAVGVDFAGRAHTLVVSGPPGSGRSNTLSALAVSLLANGARILVLTPRESPLRRLDRHAAATVLTGIPTPGDLDNALAALGGPGIVLVDDADLLGMMSPVEPLLRQVVATGQERGLGLVAAATPETWNVAMSGWLAETKRARQGLLLSPQSVMEGDLIGVRLPANLIRRIGPAGRGYVVDPATGALSAILVPHSPLG